jgi:hypothetical protein
MQSDIRAADPTRVTLGMSQTTKQPWGSGLCLMACVATMTGMDFELLYQEESPFLGQILPGSLPYMKLSRAVARLALHGLGTGMFLQFEPGQEVGVGCELLISSNINTTPALLSVQTKENSVLHSVVWDNETQSVRDPDPRMPDLMPLSHYAVLEWLTIYRIED